MGGVCDIKVTVKINGNLNAKLDKMAEKQQAMLKQEVAKGCEKYVPADSMTLTRSVQPSIDTKDPYLIYNTPYARKQYYSAPNKSKDIHPDATMQWFEKWKQADGKATIERIKKAVKL